MTSKGAGGPGRHYKDLVRDGYDRCAARYAAARQCQEEPALDLLKGRLTRNARVLDIGCGAGVPVAQQLARTCEVTGVDISTEMVRFARQNVPDATFIRSDIMSIDLPDAHFDAAVALYSIFHVPREEHRALMDNVYGWLKHGGLFLATLSAEHEDPYLEPDFFGTTMYWSNFGLIEYMEMLGSVGFDVLVSDTVGHGYKSECSIPAESHPLILAQKPQNSTGIGQEK